VKTAFNTLEIDASGHRLRAYFLTELVRDLYLTARAAHGRMFDARTILDQAAEIAGHADPTSLKPYLSRVMKEDTFRPGETVLVEDPDDAAMLRTLADALSTGDGQTRVPMRRMLAMLLDKFHLSPVKMAKQ
jgi:DNA polymerase III gamma/tau subunit